MKPYKKDAGNIRGTQILPNTQGFLISCRRGRERDASIEVKSLFDEYDRQEDKQPELSTIEDSLSHELKELVSAKKRYKIVVLAECLLWARISFDPIDMHIRIMNDLISSSKRKTRYTSRIIPIENTCHASFEEIKEMTKQLTAKCFGTNPTAYSIVPKTRNNTHMDRKKLIEAVASCIEPHHIVDLKNPKVVIIVQIFKTICGVSIVTDYYEKRSFNVEEIYAMRERNDESKILYIE